MQWQYVLVSVISLATVTTGASGSELGVVSDGPPPEVHKYLPFFVTYMPYAETLWHDAGQGSYWGDGGSGGNGGIRGTSNLTLAAAMLVYATDHGWLTPSQQETLTEAGLDRDSLVERINRSWVYLAAGHLSGDGQCADGKQWGRSWQSSLWLGASGLAAILVWDDLDAGLRESIGRVVVDEANQRIGVPPPDATPGNTRAEENGWDTHAPAVAAALFPKHENSSKWLRTAQLLAANTYSVAADHTSDARLGTDRMGDVVTTTNVQDDFTLDNHGFFHPSYQKVSGQELGEALLILRLGDRRHGTALAPRLEPYAMHHVADTWGVLRAILLPEGEFAFPSGRDWALHISTDQSYFAFIATALGDPAAILAEQQGLLGARMRMQASTGGRIHGATNFEWWWEPIFLKRCSTAMLHFAVNRPGPAGDRGSRSNFAALTDTLFLPDAQIVAHRTPRYFASVSMRRRPNGLMIPLGKNHLKHPFLVTPRSGSILPPGTVTDFSRHDHSRGTAVMMDYADGGRGAMVALEEVVLWASSDTLGPVAIQNDNVVTGTGRQVISGRETWTVAPLVQTDPFTVERPWLNIDGQLGLVSESGFQYTPAGEYTRRSAAEDLITANRGPEGTYLITAPRYSAEETARLAEEFTVIRNAGLNRVQLRDGSDGPIVQLTLDMQPRARAVAPVEISLVGKLGRKSTIAELTDNDHGTFAVFYTTDGKGPSADDPVVLEFSMPPGAKPARAVQIVPRPGYGPRKIRLEVRPDTAWHELAGTEIGSDSKTIELPDDTRGNRFRLTISSSWDRGTAPADGARNTQIAEIGFLIPVEPPGSQPNTNFDILVIQP